MVSRFIAHLALSLGLVACAPKAPGAFSPSGFQHAKYGYGVRALDAEGSLLPEGWRIDNVVAVAEGRSRGCRRASGCQQPVSLQPKEAGGYRTTFDFDMNDDGTVDKTTDALVYDLRFVHNVHSGVIWVRTFPVSGTLREKDLRVLAQDYVDSIAGADYEVVSLRQGETIIERRFAAELLGRRQGTLAGTPAFAVRFGLANIDQVHVTQAARRREVEVVIARLGVEHVEHYRRTEHKFPVLLVAGYASLPEDFARGMPDFDGLLRRIHLESGAGVSLTPVAESSAEPASPADAAPPSAAPAEPAPPAAPEGSSAPAPSDPAAAPPPATE